MARRSVTTIALLCLATLAGSQPARAQDVAAGEKVFRSQCSACHSPLQARNGVGPSLFGIDGRMAGSAANFRYTQANRDSGLVWDATTLDRYLQAPRQVVPGTAMSYAGLKGDTQRADLIAYLQSLK